MEPLFTNKSTFTKQNIIEVSQGTSSRKLWTLLFIWIGLLIFLIGLMTSKYAFCLLGILIGILYPTFSRWAVRHSATNRYQQLQQLHHAEIETANSFYEDHFDVHSVQDGADNTVAYSQIAKVYETKNLFFLMLSSRIGFMFEKQGFEGTTADEFGQFIRERAVGEGQIALRKRKRKAAFIMTAVLSVCLVIGFVFGFLGDFIENSIPKTFSHGSYSIRLTSAFEGKGDEWISPDVIVYYFCETGEELIDSGSAFESAAAYLQDMNDAYDINSEVVAVSDSRAWTAYTDKYEGYAYFYYDYVIMSDGDFWYTGFYCLEKDAGQYRPLFEKWAQTIVTDPVP
jgi:hypothetical protein